MTLAALSKEQKQYMVLGVLAVVAVVALAVFGIKGSLFSIAVAKGELQEIADKIETADRALAKSKQTSKEFIQTSSDLKLLLKTLPPSRNYYSWATEIIYSLARSTELDIDAIDELAVVRSTEANQKEAPGLRLETYTLRITARSGYRNARRFLALIEEEHPLARVIGMEISSGSKPDTHNIQLTIQWLFNPEAIAQVWDSVAAKQLAVNPQPLSTAKRQAAPDSQPEARAGDRGNAANQLKAVEKRNPKKSDPALGSTLEVLTEESDENR
jgi:hypothetical protein